MSIEINIDDIFCKTTTTAKKCTSIKPVKETIFIPCTLEFNPTLHVPTNKTFGEAIESRQRNAVYYGTTDGLVKPEEKYDAAIHNVYPLILVAYHNEISGKIAYKWVTAKERY